MKFKEPTFFLYKYNIEKIKKNNIKKYKEFLNGSD